VTKIGRFGLSMLTALAFSSSALAWDFGPRRENAAPATTSGFGVNQDVTLNMSAVVVAAHATPTMPTILPYNSSIPIVNIEPVVTTGTRPLVVGGAPCVITIYGADAAGNLYDISQAAWMTVPQVATWSGGPIPTNPKDPIDPSTVLQVSVPTNPNSPSQAVGLTFTEQAPAVQPDPAYNIQVTAVVVMNQLLSNGSAQTWTFSDLVSTVAAGTVVPPPAPTYDVTLEIPGDPPSTMRLLNVPAASLTAAP
jgi:hypothetical protein